MRILNIAPIDLCNICITLSHGINEFSSDTSLSITFTPAELGFDFDVLFKGHEKMLMNWIQQSDLLHLNAWHFRQKVASKIIGGIPFPVLLNLLDFWDKYDLHASFSGTPETWKVSWDYYRNYINRHMLKKKKILLHYHGSDLRMFTSKADKEFIDRQGFKVVVSVPDLIPHLKAAKWLPIPVPTDDEIFRPPPKRDDRVIKIIHSPTMREAKKTRVLIEAVEALKRKYDVELMLLENIPYRECLRIKKEGHILFDNIQFGSYAGCSIEAMCHEQPTLVYLNAVSQQQIDMVSEEIGVDPPFLNVGDKRQPSIQYLTKVMQGKACNIITKEDYRSVYDTLEMLILDSNLRKELGTRGRKWVTRVHDTKEVVKKLLNMYYS
jgi:hypothetical protein